MSFGLVPRMVLALAITVPSLPFFSISAVGSLVFLSLSFLVFKFLRTLVCSAPSPGRILAYLEP